MADSNQGRDRGRGNNYFRGRGGRFYRKNWRSKGQQKSKEAPPENSEVQPRGNPTPARENTRQTRINQLFVPIPCPFQGWPHYFPNEEFTPTSIMYRKTIWFKDYLERKDGAFNLDVVKEETMFLIDHQDLISEKDLQEAWPQLKDDIVNDSFPTLAALSLAMHQLLVEASDTQSTQDSTGDSQKKKLNKTPFVRARLTNYRPLTLMKNLGAAYYGKMVAVNATVVRVSNTKPLCLSLAFQCRKCSAVLVIHQADGKYKPPVRCTAEIENVPCTGTQFQPLRGSMKNTIVDWQTIRLQEKSSDGLEVGRIPRTVDCELMEDLVDTCSPGEIAVVIGVLKVVGVSDPDRRTGTKDKNMFSYYIDAVAIHNQDRGNKSSAESDGINSSLSSTKGTLSFNLKDYEAIQKIHAEPNLFAFLVASLCPSIFGHEVVKAGLLLALFGGSQQKRGSDQGDAKNHFKRRPDIHVLVVGDPGLGKSQMLQACTQAAPRGVYVCGSSTTNSGLTVTLTKDSQSNGNEYSLEAGALVLGDQGICCIDEFDKMHGQHQALLEAMEQQSISLAKAGVVCSLPARTSVLAAANPVGGHYNRAKTVSENIKMGSALLSRFDLVFLLLDRPSADMDTMLTNHIMALHGGRNSDSKWPTMNKSTSCSEMSKDTLLGRLQLDAESQLDLLPIPLLRKYVAYAREYVHPYLQDGAKREILKFYVELRQTRFSGDCTAITHRQLESLVRLTQARARAELRETATDADARDVVELVRTSFNDVFRNEAGILDFTRSQNGSGMSSRNQCKRFIAAVQKVADSAYKNLFGLEELRSIANQLGMEKINFQNMIDTLNNQGLLLKKGPKTYQLQVVDY